MSLDLGADLPERGPLKRVYAELNRLKTALRRLQPVKSLNLLTHETGLGVAREAFEGGGEPGEPGVIKQFRVQSIQNDYLTCREYSGTAESGPEVKVAKPFNLRTRPWQGLIQAYTIEPYPGSPGALTVTYAFPQLSADISTYRIATVRIGNVGTSEHQVVIPRWVPGVSVIFASASQNGTGVPLANDWQDLNADGRAWAKAV